MHTADRAAVGGHVSALRFDRPSQARADAAARVRAEIEIYPNALHGWRVPDNKPKENICAPALAFVFAWHRIGAIGASGAIR